MAFKIRLRKPVVALLDNRKHPFIQGGLHAGMYTKFSQIIGANARKHTPHGATGNLNRNIGMAVDDLSNTRSQFTATWLEPYAGDVNSGRRPQLVEPALLRAWTDLKWGSHKLARKLSRHILKHGTKANNFLTKTHVSSRVPVVNAFVGTFNAYVKKLMQR